jgi:signal transduction histidine kinase
LLQCLLTFNTEEPLQIPATLLKTFNATLNELNVELALIALKEEGFGPFQSHAHRGFSPREIQAVVRALSHPEVGFDGAAGNGDTAPKAIRIRMTAPSHRSLLGIPLRHERRTLGALVIGRKDIAAFTEKDRRRLEGTAGELVAALTKAGLTAMVSPGPPPAQPATAARESARHRAHREPAPADLAPASSGVTKDPEFESLMAEVRASIPYERALLTWYEAGTKTLAAFLSHVPGQCEWREGRTLALDGSAAGWVIRHKKPRLDRDLASTQGRFLDYKELYKDKFKTALVLPLRKEQDLIGTIALATRTPDMYHADMARAAASALGRLANFVATMGSRSAVPAERTFPAEAPAEAPDIMEARELMLRQERQAAIRELTGFLEQEIQRPLTKTRLGLEDTLRESSSGRAFSESALQGVDQACRDLTRIEAILNEVLDHAKPLDLRPRVVRLPEIIESAVAVIAGELEQKRVTVTRQFSDNLPNLKADEGKLQQVFLSILKNALEAMTPDGHIHLEAAPHRGPRSRHEVAITIQNDGAPIPTEHIGKIFEPGFTTKAAGTGLGLSSVKKIIQEHRGQISIASGPGQGTTVVIRLPAQAAPRPAGRNRRRPRRR